MPAARVPQSPEVRTLRRSTFAGCAASTRRRGAADELFWFPGERPDVVLKFADGGVKRYRESALPADQIGPLEFYAEAMAFLGYFERAGGKRDDVILPVDLEGTFQGFIERRHFDCRPRQRQSFRQSSARRKHPVDCGEMTPRIG
jgi:hypothetical protein